MCLARALSSCVQVVYLPFFSFSYVANSERATAAGRVVGAEMVAARVARVAAGDWTYATAKLLHGGGAARAMREAKLDGGMRVLWEEVRRSGAEADALVPGRAATQIVVWFVAKHDDVPRRLRQIQASDLRRRNLFDTAANPNDGHDGGHDGGGGAGGGGDRAIGSQSSYAYANSGADGGAGDNAEAAQQGPLTPGQSANIQVERALASLHA